MNVTHDAVFEPKMGNGNILPETFSKMLPAKCYRYSALFLAIFRFETGAKYCNMKMLPCVTVICNTLSYLAVSA